MKIKIQSLKWLIMDFQKWCNDVTNENPMMLETDPDDVADMYLTERFGSPQKLEAFERMNANHENN
jgi:hypothetical protein